MIFRAKASLVPEYVKAEMRDAPLGPKYKNVRKQGKPKQRAYDVAEAQGEVQPSVIVNVEEPNANTSNESTSGSEDKTSFCPECYLPLFPDPPPDKLFIYLHALRYTTSLGTFETPMPPWARDDYVLNSAFSP